MSSLRLTINDEADESFEIWGDSCRTTGCGGPGVMKHKFGATGDAQHNGKVIANELCIGNICLNASDIAKIKASILAPSPVAAVAPRVASPPPSVAVAPSPVAAVTPRVGSLPVAAAAPRVIKAPSPTIKR